jgi:hypothetical protein
MQDTKRFEGKNVEIKHFPFIHYRQYLPVVYSHMLISAFLQTAHLDVFHSPEGLIPFLYPGNIITTFHHVPKGDSESNLFVRTIMLGARMAFAQLCRRAKRIIVSSEKDKQTLVDRHGYAATKVVIMPDKGKPDWKSRVRQLLAVYDEVGKLPVKKPAATT